MHRKSFTISQLSSEESLSWNIRTCTSTQGQHLQRGSRLDDFDIVIGDAECVPDSLTDNEVQCQPSTFEQNNVNDTSCLEDTLSVHVGICYFLYNSVRISKEKAH